jgi:hypothetical protein
MATQRSAGSGFLGRKKVTQGLSLSLSRTETEGDDSLNGRGRQIDLLDLLA